MIPWARAITASFESLAVSREVFFDTEFPQARCETYFDEVKLEQILVNLLSNAFKYTASKGDVKFSMSVLTDVVEFEVRNTGQQIPDDEKGKIFDRFYQSEHVNKVEGSGIGLALVKEFTELHHGSVRVYDDNHHMCPEFNNATQLDKRPLL